MSLITLIQQLRQASEFSKAEARIADAVLAGPEAIVNMTTAELARRAKVSDPMISRFCRSLGRQSFPEFKVQLAQDLATQAAGVSHVTEAVAPDDRAPAYINKRINANLAALEYLRQHIRAEDVEQAVAMLCSARQIIICGMGGSAAIAQDAQHKLFRLGTPTIAYTDPLMQRMAASSADPDTLMLFISFTGRTRETLEIAQLAHAQGAHLLGLTPPHSPLGSAVDLCITSGEELEDTTVYVPMTVRIIILTIIDILTTGMALRQGQAGDTRLERIKESLIPTKLP